MSGLDALPEGVLLGVLSAVPAPDLILRCRPVCSLWREAVDSPALWRLKCQRAGYEPGGRNRDRNRNRNRDPPDWRIFYLLHLWKRNLLANPMAAERFQHWDKKQNGGDRWKVEKLPGGHGRPFPDSRVQKYFVTSYHSCLKSQTIDLKKEGYPSDFLDVMQPPIIIKDWYAARHDCGCRYQILVQLLSGDRTVMAEFKPEPIVIPQWSDAEWAQISHTFTDYGPGLHYIYFEHGGEDTQFWAGWYGIRVTNSSVTIDPGDLCD